MDKNWRVIGSKYTLNNVVSQITGISSVAELSLRWTSVATKMSWASKRECTRSEDLAYSLMGLFNVNMPLLYGEGGEKAFLRLHLEILRSSDDESIFAWDYPYQRNATVVGGMLASSPSYFLRSSNVHVAPSS